MTLIRTCVTPQVLKQIKSNGFCNANDVDKIRYSILIKKSNWTNFFFGMELNNSDLSGSGMSGNDENTIELILDIPEERLFKTDFYNFSSWLYYKFDEENTEKLNCYENLIGTSYLNEETQVNFQTIYHSDIVKESRT